MILLTLKTKGTLSSINFVTLEHSSLGKESACNAGDPSSIPGLGRSLGEVIGYPFQYSWASLVAQLVKNPPAMREIALVQSLVRKIPWRREKLLTPVFWPREFHGLYSRWGRKELDLTEQLSTFGFQVYILKKDFLPGDKAWECCLREF